MGKAYRHTAVETNRYEEWAANDLFEADNQSPQPVFSMILLPPGITDPLHMGHALTFTMSDIVIRRKRMQHFNTLWVPGILHAGLDARGQAAKERLHKLGLSLAWSRMKSAFAPGMGEIAEKVFVRLYKRGKIYRDSPLRSRSAAGSAVLSGLEGDKEKTRGEEESPDVPQWFLRTAEIVGPFVRSLEEKKITFIPGKWGRACLDWMKGRRDWRISYPFREGHRIPAYYCGSCGHIMVEAEKPGVCGCCRSGPSGITQDRNVLDPGFCLALWPLVALGGDRDTKDFHTYYPTSLLVAGHAPFPAVGRMILLGLHSCGDIPFREILVYGPVKDEAGQRMDKTGDNGVKPIDIIEKYGADALRFTLAAQSVSGRPVSFLMDRVKEYRAFANKIWNASRYVIMNAEVDAGEGEDFNVDFNRLTETDKWILDYLNRTVERIDDLMDNHRIRESAALLYRFFRHQYCDWYLEFSKNDLENPGTKKVLRLSLFRLLQLLHPFMPFITEEIYRRIRPDGGEDFLVQTAFPAFDSRFVFSDAFSSIERLKKVIQAVRKTRMENGIPPHREANIFLKTGSEKERENLWRVIKYFDFLAGSAHTEITDDFADLPRGYRGEYADWEILLPFEQEADRLSELDRVKREYRLIEERIKELEAKLTDENFVRQASGSAVFNFKKNLQASIERREKIQKTIRDLS